MYEVTNISGINARSDKKKVLIIDDEKDLCLLLKTYLAKNNFEVNTAYTLSDGLQLIEQTVPDVLLLDNNLPDGLGWTVAPQLAKDYPQMQIKLISAHRNVLPEMPEESNYTLIEKPIRLSDLSQQLL